MKRNAYYYYLQVPEDGMQAFPQREESVRLNAHQFSNSVTNRSFPHQYISGKREKAGKKSGKNRQDWLALNQHRHRGSRMVLATDRTFLWFLWILYAESYKDTSLPGMRIKAGDAKNFDGMGGEMKE